MAVCLDVQHVQGCISLVDSNGTLLPYFQLALIKFRRSYLLAPLECDEIFRGMLVNHRLGSFVI